MKTESKIDNCLGAFIGLAVGDALGTTNEFSTMEECIHITDMIGGGPFELPPPVTGQMILLWLCVWQNPFWKWTSISITSYRNMFSGILMDI